MEHGISRFSRSAPCPILTSGREPGAGSMPGPVESSRLARAPLSGIQPPIGGGAAISSPSTRLPGGYCHIAVRRSFCQFSHPLGAGPHPFPTSGDRPWQWSGPWAPSIAPRSILRMSGSGPSCLISVPLPWSLSSADSILAHPILHPSTSCRIVGHRPDRSFPLCSRYGRIADPVSPMSSRVASRRTSSSVS